MQVSKGSLKFPSGDECALIKPVYEVVRMSTHKHIMCRKVHVPLVVHIGRNTLFPLIGLSFSATIAVSIEI